jgi:hypothetical protein
MGGESVSLAPQQGPMTNNSPFSFRKVTEKTYLPSEGVSTSVISWG